MNKKLVELERERIEKAATLTVANVDSQSIKIAPFTSKEKGIDGSKKVNGRKRHIITDVNGLILRVLVGAANEHDSKGGIRLFMKDENFFSQIKHFFVDHAYGEKFRALIEKYGSKIELAAKPEGTKGLNNRHIFGRLFFGYTSLLFIAIVKTITKNNASSTKKIPAPKNDDYLRLGT